MDSTPIKVVAREEIKKEMDPDSHNDTGSELHVRHSYGVPVLVV